MRPLTACLILSFWMMLGGASGATGQTTPDRGYSTRPTAADPADSCQIWRDQRDVFRLAYRYRLHDLIRARAETDSVRIEGETVADSMRIELRWRDRALEAVTAERPPWYLSPPIVFGAGALFGGIFGAVF